MGCRFSRIAFRAIRFALAKAVMVRVVASVKDVRSGTQDVGAVGSGDDSNPWIGEFKVVDILDHRDKQRDGMNELISLYRTVVITRTDDSLALTMLLDIEDDAAEPITFELRLIHVMLSFLSLSASVPLSIVSFFASNFFTSPVSMMTRAASVAFGANTSISPRLRVYVQ